MSGVWSEPLCLHDAQELAVKHAGPGGDHEALVDALNWVDLHTRLVHGSEGLPRWSHDQAMRWHFWAAMNLINPQLRMDRRRCLLAEDVRDYVNQFLRESERKDAALV